MISEILIAVPLFVFMGVMLERSKVAEELLDTMGMLFGAMRGRAGNFGLRRRRLAGGLDRHCRRDRGDDGGCCRCRRCCGGATARRSPAGRSAPPGTLGQIIPPSLVLVVLGDQISDAYQEAQRKLGNFAPDPVSVGDLFAGALLPGLALVGMYILYQVFIAWLRAGILAADSARRAGAGPDEPRNRQAGLPAPWSLPWS